MVQIKITRAELDGDDFATGEDGIVMMCLLDNGWLMVEWKDDGTMFYPPHRINWAEGVV